MKIFIFALLMASFLLTSCMSAVDVAKPYGENLIITFNDHKRNDYGELIHVTDSTFIYRCENKFITASYDTLYSLFIEDYKVPSRGPALFGSILVDAIMLGAAFNSQNKGDIWTKILTVLHTAATFWGMVRDMPRTNFSPPFSENDLALLRAYSRYPDWFPGKFISE